VALHSLHDRSCDNPCCGGTRWQGAQEKTSTSGTRQHLHGNWQVTGYKRNPRLLLLCLTPPQALPPALVPAAPAWQCAHCAVQQLLLHWEQLLCWRSVGCDMSGCGGTGVVQQHPGVYHRSNTRCCIAVLIYCSCVDTLLMCGSVVAFISGQQRGLRLLLLPQLWGVQGLCQTAGGDHPP
jgi:hypothetical protein